MSNSEFDTKLSEVARLTKLAIGHRTITSFSAQSRISVSTLSRLLHDKLPQTPSPKILGKIAQASEYRVTYEELLIAAGYSVDSFSNELSKCTTLSPNISIFIISDDVVEICTRIEKLAKAGHKDFITFIVLVKKLNTLITLQNLDIEVPNNITIHYALVLE